jgi:hypothetical protein
LNSSGEQDAVIVPGRQVDVDLAIMYVTTSKSDIKCLFRLRNMSVAAQRLPLHAKMACFQILQEQPIAHSRWHQRINIQEVICVSSRKTCSLLAPRLYLQFPRLTSPNLVAAGISLHRRWLQDCQDAGEMWTERPFHGPTHSGSTATMRHRHCAGEKDGERCSGAAGR